MEKKNFYISGAIGGFFVVGLLLIFYFGLNLFNYQLILEPKYIDIKSFPIPGIIGPAERHQLLDSLKSNHIVLSPEEYTSHVVDYYNIAFLVMSAMLVVFTLLSFVHFRTTIREIFFDMLKKKEFQESVADTLTGRAEEYYGNKFDGYDDTIKKNKKKIDKLEKQIATLQEIVSNIENNNTEGYIRR